MPHGYCTGCGAVVTVRDGRCLLGHAIESSELLTGRGRHAHWRRRKIEYRAPKTRSRRNHRQPTPPRPTHHAPTRYVGPSAVPAGAPREQTIVDRLWEETADHAPVVDWVPGAGSFERLDGRYRRSRLVTLVMVPVIALAGWLAWISVTDTDAAAARQKAATAISDLDTALIELRPLLATPGADGGDRAALVTALGDVDAAARRMTVSAGGLPVDTDGSSRERARMTEVASRASGLETTLGVTDAAAALVNRNVAPPVVSLPADPLDIPDAVATLQTWWTDLEATLDEIPTHPMLTEAATAIGEERARAGVIVDQLTAALERADRPAAGELATQLETAVGSIRVAMDGARTAVVEWAITELDGIRSDVARLTPSG